MPDMDGAMTPRKIRDSIRPDRPPIIMLTSMDVKASEPDIQKEIVQATLMKPARSSELLEKLVNVLAGRSAAESRAWHRRNLPATSASMVLMMRMHCRRS
jgi:DNA-binding response OmpR family regulator